MKLTVDAFLKQAIVYFPHLESEFIELDGLHYLQVDCFRQETEVEMKNFSADKLKSIFSFVEEYYLQGDDKIKDIIDVSFVEAVFAGHDIKTI